MQGAAQRKLRKMSYVIMMMHKTKDWCDKADHPLVHSWGSTKAWHNRNAGRGGKMAIQWIPRWNGSIYIKLMHTVHRIQNGALCLLLGRERKSKDGGGQAANCGGLISCAYWGEGQGSMIMEYYHGSVRVQDEASSVLEIHRLGCCLSALSSHNKRKICFPYCK